MNILHSLNCHFAEMRHRREAASAIDTKRIAKQRIAECFARIRKALRLQMYLAVTGIRPFLYPIASTDIDLSNLDLTDDVLAELCKTFNGKEKELLHIYCINLSGNARLTELPKEIALCKGLAVLDIKGTGINVLPQWIHEREHLSVSKDSGGDE